MEASHGLRSDGRRNAQGELPRGHDTSRSRITRRGAEDGSADDGEKQREGEAKFTHVSWSAEKNFR
jgi:hypothetical protein